MAEEMLAAELEIFARGESVADQTRALSSLTKLKKLHQAAKESGFERGLDKLSRFAAEANAEDRLFALAALSRLGFLVKPQQKKIAGLLEVALVIEPSDLQLLDDPDDRYYLASVWRLTVTPWLSQYLAKAAVDEEGSDKVRLECMEGLISINPDLATVLRDLSTPLRRLSFSTEKPGDSKGKRVRRVLEGLNAVYASCAKEPGDDAGEKFKAFLIDCFVHNGLPTKPLLLNEVAEGALGVVHQIIRARFPLATSTGTYSALDVIKSWYRDPDWADYAEHSEAASLLSRDLSAALEILVRAGSSDEHLFSKLVIAAGGQQRARTIAKEILTRLPGLPEELAQWLSGIPPRRKSTLATESQMLAFDDALADLIVTGRRLGELAEQVSADALPEIGVMSPQAAAPIENLLGTVRSTVNAISGIARARDLSIRGNASDIVEFSPLEHEMIGGTTAGVRSVRIVRPAVEAPGTVGGRRILRKALVEPVK
jgi:hypothetical protein